MTDYNVTVGKELLPELLSSQNGLAKLIEGILNQILEAQVTESLGAEKHERADERIGYRNGYRSLPSLHKSWACYIASTSNPAAVNLIDDTP